MADDTLPKPADQVAAGGTAQPADTGGIIDALRSRGPAPQSALQNIAQPPLGGLMGMGQMMMPPAPMPANLGIAAGSGMLAGLAGRQTNPYLQQQGQEQERAQKYQQEMLRMQERQQAQREKQNEAVLSIADGLLQSDNPEARLSGAQTKSALYKNIYGFDTKPEYWTKRIELSGAERDRVDALLAAGVSPADISAVVPKVAQMPAGWLDSEKRMLSNPGVRRALGIKSQEALELEGITETQDLKLAKDKAAARARVDSGTGTLRDQVILGADSVPKLVEGAIRDSVVNGTPIPPDILPYVKSMQREQQLKGYTGKFRLAMEAAGGDPAKALEIIKRDKTTKLNASEFEFNLNLEQQGLLAKQRAGTLTPRETQKLAAIKDYFAGGDAGSTETVSRKAVTITDQMAPGLQAGVNELAARLPNDDLPTVDLHDGHPPVLKSKLLRSMWMREHPNQEIEIQWTGKQWTPVRLWDINKTTKGRVARPGTVLNPGTTTATNDDSDSED